MDDKTINIDAKDLEISWDEAPEIPKAKPAPTQTKYKHDPLRLEMMREASSVIKEHGKDIAKEIVKMVGQAERFAMVEDDKVQNVIDALKSVKKSDSGPDPQDQPEPQDGPEKAPSDDCSQKPQPEESLKLREQWLREAFQRITGQPGTISCGYGKGGSRSNKGYSVHKDEDGGDQVFIHPHLSDKEEVLQCVSVAALDMGLNSADVSAVASAMPPYPQHKLADDKSDKKDGIRQLKVVCPVCGYTARTSRKWLESAGAPFCPSTHEITDKNKDLEFIGWPNADKIQLPHAMFQMIEPK